MDKKASDTFAFDLDNRLDDFFSDSLPHQDETPEEESPAPATEFPLKGLKSAILAIDWEITDDALEALINQIDGLFEQFEHDKVNHTLLRLLKSLSKYLRNQKSNAHPDAIKRVLAVYSTLEESVSNNKLSQGDKDKMLVEEVMQFRRMKAQVVKPSAPSPASDLSKPSNLGEISGIESVIRSIDELKSLMLDELKAIREELKQILKK